MAVLMEQFVAEEATPYVRKLIFDEISQRQGNLDEAKTRFEFNRFELTIDYASEVVVIEDVLDVSPAGEEQVSLSDFMRALGD